MSGTGYEAAQEADQRRETYAKQDALDLNHTCHCGAPTMKGGCADALCPAGNASPDATVSPCHGCSDVQEHVKRVSFRRAKDGEWVTAHYCDNGEGSCLYLARAAQRGFTAYGALGLEPVFDLVVWTDYTGVCGSCGRTFRVSEQYIEGQRADLAPGEIHTDEEIASWAEHCIECCDGTPVPGEHVVVARATSHDGGTPDQWWENALKIPGVSQEPVGEGIPFHSGDPGGGYVTPGDIERYVVVQKNSYGDVCFYPCATREAVEAEVTDRLFEEGWWIDGAYDLATGEALGLRAALAPEE